MDKQTTIIMFTSEKKKNHRKGKTIPRELHATNTTKKKPYERYILATGTDCSALEIYLQSPSPTGPPLQISVLP